MTQTRNLPSDIRTVKQYLETQRDALVKAMPAHIKPDRLLRVFINAVAKEPKLQECTQHSLFSAILQSALLGLEANTPLQEAVILPYLNSKKKVMEAQFQPMYRGLLNLARRSGDLIMIYAEVVKDNDEFRYSRGLNPTLEHIPRIKADRGKAFAYYAVSQLKSGEKDFEIMSYEDVVSISHRSKNYRDGDFSGPWNTDFDEMAKKTVIKRLLKRAPISTELARAMEADNTQYIRESNPTVIARENVFEAVGLPEPEDGAKDDQDPVVTIERPQRKSESEKKAEPEKVEAA